MRLKREHFLFAQKVLSFQCPSVILIYLAYNHMMNNVYEKNRQILYIHGHMDIHIQLMKRTLYGNVRYYGNDKGISISNFWHSAANIFALHIFTFHGCMIKEDPNLTVYLHGYWMSAGSFDANGICMF